MKKNTINFVLSANNSGSITRLVAEYSNRLVSKGFNVTISYPVVNHWDYLVFRMQRKTRNFKNKALIFIHYAMELLWHVIKPMVKTILFKEYRGWIGKSSYMIDNRVKFNRYFSVPSAINMPDADCLIVMQEYLIPHLLYLPECKGKIIGSIHLDYGDGIRDSSRIMKDWWSFVVSLDRRLNVPLWVTSRGTKKTCDKLGIKLGKIIYNGIDTDKFADGKRRGKLDQLRIMLYCDPKPQKGLSFGCAVIKRLKQTLTNDNVVFCSLGNISIEQSKLFDINLGYLKENEYIRAYQETDIFIFPSLYEGFPAPPLDAMACGCALATTCVQGVEEYGVHRENCMIAEPNDLESMVNNIRTLIEDLDLRDSIRENGLLTAKKFSWENSANELVDFILQEA